MRQAILFATLLMAGASLAAPALADLSPPARQYELDGNRLQLFYTLRVVTPGRFVVPAPFAEDMYRPELRGVGRAEPDLVVVDPRAPAAR